MSYNFDPLNGYFIISWKSPVERASIARNYRKTTDRTVMNYLAHAYLYAEKPYFAAGTCVPDWLTVADRQVRVRTKHTDSAREILDENHQAVILGVRRHLLDDAAFHNTRAFAELCLDFAVKTRDLLRDEEGMRPSFLGHLLVEVLLDAVLAEREPRRIPKFYAALRKIDSRIVEAAVNAVAPRKTARLAYFIEAFIAERIHDDYSDDRRLLRRLNQVMRRVGLPPLTEAFLRMLPEARRAVRLRADELLEGIPAPDPAGLPTNPAD